MDDENLKEIRQRLDAELATADKNVGIKFGIDLYNAFARRRWFTKEKFTVLGTGAFPLEVVAYDGSHGVVADWDMPEWEFKIGKAK